MRTLCERGAVNAATALSSIVLLVPAFGLVQITNGEEEVTLEDRFRAHIAAVDNGEIEKAVSFFADDGEIMGLARGKDELRRLHQRDAAWNCEITVIDARADGNTVIAKVIEQNDYMKALGGGGAYSVECDFRDGLITQVRLKIPDRMKDQQRRARQSCDGWLRETGRKQLLEAAEAAREGRRWKEFLEIMVPLLEEWREQAIPYYEKAVSRARKALDEHPESHEHRSELALAYRSLGLARLAMEKVTLEDQFRAHVAAMNNADIEKALSFFADYARFVGVAHGKDALRTVFQRDIAWNNVITVIDARADGNTLTVTVIARNDYFKALGVAESQHTAEIDFRDGLITQIRLKIPERRQDRVRRVKQSSDGWLRETGRKQLLEAAEAAWDARRWKEFLEIKAPLLEEWREQAIPYYEKAVSRARKALDEHPESHEHRSELARAYRSLGMARLAMEKPGKGTESFERELALWMAVPDSKRTADQWSYLGQACYLVGKHEEARRALTKSIELEGETSPSIDGPRWWYLVMTLTRLGETEKASEYFVELVRMSRASGDGQSKHPYLRSEAYELLRRAERKDDKASTPASRE